MTQNVERTGVTAIDVIIVFLRFFIQVTYWKKANYNYLSHTITS